MRKEANITQELAIEHMSCNQFSDYLYYHGFDINLDSHEEILDKLATIDGEGTSTLVLDEIELRFHDCFLYYDDDELATKTEAE